MSATSCQVWGRVCRHGAILHATQTIQMYARVVAYDAARIRRACVRRRAWICKLHPLAVALSIRRISAEVLVPGLTRMCTHVTTSTAAMMSCAVGGGSECNDGAIDNRARKNKSKGAREFIMGARIDAGQDVRLRVKNGTEEACCAANCT